MTMYDQTPITPLKDMMTPSVKMFSASLIHIFCGGYRQARQTSRRIDLGWRDYIIKCPGFFE